MLLPGRQLDSSRGLQRKRPERQGRLGCAHHGHCEQRDDAGDCTDDSLVLRERRRNGALQQQPPLTLS